MTRRLLAAAAIVAVGWATLAFVAFSAPLVGAVMFVAAGLVALGAFGISVAFLTDPRDRDGGGE